MSIVDFFSTNLVELSQYIIDANKRIFWLYILSSVILAFIVYIIVPKQQKKHHFFAYLLPKKIFLSHSAKQDYLLFIANKFIKAIIFPVVVVTMVPIALAISSGLEGLFGTFEHLTLEKWQVISIFTFLLFLVDDFTRFLLHYLLHKVPILWEFHKVHHSAKVLTPMTIYRSHPVENYLYACRMALTQGVVVGVCYYFLGPTLKMFDILGANAFVFVFNIMGANLRHSHIWLSWGDKIEHWFISPAQHQVHHSADKEYYDVNFGSALAVWDRITSSLVKASGVKTLTLGVSDDQADHSSIMKIYLEPFIRIYRKVSLFFIGKA